MKVKFLVLFLLFAAFSFSNQSLASSAKSVAETQVESSGGTQVYQSVETTVDGQTVRKESTQPGKLELKMEKTGEGQPTVTFSQESATITPTPTPSQTPSGSLISQLIEFFQKLISRLSRLMRLSS